MLTTNKSSSISLVNKKSKRIKILSNTLIYILLIVIAIFCAGPFIWMVSSSFKGSQNIYEMSLIPKNATLANYKGVVEFLNIEKYLLNTIIITVGGIVIDVVLSSLCAYPLATMEFYGKKIIFTALISTMILPAAAGLIVNYLTI